MVEVWYVSNAYLYGQIDTTVCMKQRTDSTVNQERSRIIFKFKNSIYRLRSSWMYLGFLFVVSKISWDFELSKNYARVFYNAIGKQFIIAVIIIDDRSFFSNSLDLLEHLNRSLLQEFDVKLFGILTSFLSWEVHQNQDGIKVSEHCYVGQLLDSNVLREATTASTPLLETFDIV